MGDSLKSSEVLSILVHDSDLGAVALNRISPELKRRLNLLVRGVEVSDARYSTKRMVISPLGVREAYLEFSN